VVAALAAALAATAAASGGYPDAGLDVVGPDGVISAVSPAGFAWRDGIRAGQVVVRIDSSLSPGGWAVEVRDAGRTLTSRSAPYEAALRDMLPLCLAALAVGGLSLVLLRGRRAWSPAAACASLLLAAPALALYGKPESSTVVMALAAAAPVVWIGWRPRLPAPVGVVTTLAAAVFIAVWAASRLGAGDGYGQLEAVRDAATFLGTALVVILSVVAPLARADSVGLARPRLADLGAAGAVGGLALAGAMVYSMPVPVLGVVALAALIALPAWRRGVAYSAERLLLADMREQAAIEAGEAERAHLSRELHDAPLQELAGVIRRLEVLPGARHEADRLREVAQQLRGMATELRPPVLDDLGVVPAIEFVAEAASAGACPVTVAVEDGCGLEPGERPPANVELAAFRIAQEAIANAVRHAGAAAIRVTGRVSPVAIELEIADDGRGLAPDAASSAARRGRLGLASMRRRAQAVDADLSIEGSAGGTRVRLRWRA
jgi:signal transduction histidine kinase